MYKVDVSINWWTQDGKTLGKQHTFYQNVFRRKFVADLVLKLMSQMAKFWISERQLTLARVTVSLEKHKTVVDWEFTRLPDYKKFTSLSLWPWFVR